MPKPGDRCGFIYGPSGHNPDDDAGTVMSTAVDRWGNVVASILMDDGRIDQHCGSYTTAGIGCHLISPMGVGTFLDSGDIALYAEAAA